jgi:hypothetical protein
LKSRRVFSSGRFDVIAITDHILRKRDVLEAAARLATFGRRRFSVVEISFADSLGEIAEEAQPARRLYGMLVLPGAETTRNHVRAKNSIPGRRWCGVGKTGRHCARRCSTM